MERHSIWREGLIAGAVGASAVALWFLVADAIVSRPLDTPARLGQGLLGVFGEGAPTGMAAQVIAYSIFHFAAFMVVGVIASTIVNAAERQPSVLAGAMLLFVVFEVGFYLLSSALADELLVGRSAMLVAGGNVFAALSMGTYLWRAHPSLGAELRYALEGRE